MTEIQRHFLNKDGEHFVVPFDSKVKAKAYTPPKGAIEISAPQANKKWDKEKKEWVDILYIPPVILSNREKLERLLARSGLTIADLKEILEQESKVGHS